MKYIQNKWFLISSFILFDIFLFLATYFHWVNSISILLIILINWLLAALYVFTLALSRFKKSLLIISYGMANSIIAFLLIFSTMFIPYSKEHNYVMYQVCFPEMRKKYGIGENQPFPAGEVDAQGNGKWWYQHGECEENVYAGRGPVFSENPKGFIPVKK